MRHQEIIWLPNNHISGLGITPERGATHALHKAYARKELSANWILQPAPGDSVEALKDRIAEAYADWMGNKEAWSFELDGIGDPTLDEIVANLCLRCRRRSRPVTPAPPLWTIFGGRVSGAQQQPEGSGWAWVALGVGAVAFALVATRKKRKGRRR